MKMNFGFSLFLTIYFLSFNPNSLQAQYSDYVPATAIRAAYMGSVIYPGFSIAVERPYKFIEKDKVGYGKRIKTIFKERYLGLSFNMYHHENHHTNFMLQAEWIRRRQNLRGFFMQTNMGLGVSRTFFDGPTYEVRDNGDIEKVDLAGHYYGVLSVGAAFGYNFNMKLFKPFSLYVKPGAILMAPYNNFVTGRGTLEMGVLYTPKDFWKAEPKKDYKRKVKKRHQDHQD